MIQRPNNVSEYASLAGRSLRTPCNAKVNIDNMTRSVILYII